MYGFIYLTINLVNGRMYIGQKKYDKAGKWKHYLGSGKAIKNAFKKYGKKNFVKIILENCKTRAELSDAERRYIKEFDCINDPLFYNIAEGGEGGNESLNAEAHKIKVKVFPDKIFDSIQDAAIYIGCSHGNIERACTGYHECKGFEVWYVKDLEEYKPLEYFKEIKSKNVSNSQLSRKDKKKIILMPEGKIFNTMDECLKYTGGTKKGIWDFLVRNSKVRGTKNGYRGFDIWWLDDIDLYTTPEERAAREFERRSVSKKKT